MKTSFDFFLQTLLRAGYKNFKLFARFADLVRFFINNKGAIIIILCCYFWIQIATVICTWWCHSSNATYTQTSEGLQEANRVFDGLSVLFLLGKNDRRGRKRREIVWKIVYVSMEQLAIVSPVKWSYFTFLSIYFYIHEMMGKRADDSEEFRAPKWLIHLWKIGVGSGEANRFEESLRWRNCFKLLQLN
jgi:hypothetical protein